MRFPLIVLLSFSLASCALQQPEKYVDGSGRVLYRIECKEKIDGCKAMAEKTCPNGYETEVSFFLPVTYCMSGVSSKVDMYYMSIECK